MTVHPRPVQIPHPPVRVAAASPTSVERVARHDWNLLIGQAEPFSQVSEQVEHYRSALGEAGLDYNPGRVGVARPMYTAATEEEARRDTETPFIWFKQSGQEVGAPPENQVDLLPEDYRLYRIRLSRDETFDYNSMFENVVLFGTPIRWRTILKSCGTRVWRN